MMVDDNNYRVSSVSAGDDSYKKFVDHPVKIYHNQVTSATTSVNITDDLFRFYMNTISTMPVGKKYSNFSFCRATLCLRVVVQGQPFAAGKLILAATPIPLTDYNVTSTSTTLKVIKQGSKVNSQIVPHLDIDPSKSDTYELKLPICTLSGAYSIKGPSTGSYRLELIVFNALFSGTAVAASANICVYMHLEDVDMEGITLTSSAFVEEKKEGGTLSAIAKGSAVISNVAGKVFPVLSPFTTLFSTVAGAAGDVLAFFGYAKPPQVENWAPILNRFTDNYTQFDGKSTSQVLAGSATTSLGISPLYGGGKGDDMSLIHIASIPGLVHQGTIAPAAGAGSLITSLALNPCAFMTDAGGRGVTPLAGVTIPFDYWVGDLIVEVEVIASVFHRATIMVAWDPVATAGLPPDFEDAVQTLKNVTIAVSGRSNTKIRIPFKKPVNYAWSYSYSTTTITYDQMTNGNLFFYVVNPVTSNGSTDSIAFNVYYSSDNMRWYSPSTLNLLSNRFLDQDMVLEPSPLLLRESLPKLTRQAAFRLEEERDEVLTASQAVEVSFGPKSDLSKAGVRAFGEDYTSVKHLTSKLTLFCDKTVDIPHTSTLNYVGAIVPNFPYRNSASYSSATTGISTNFAGWFASAYLGYRGGMKFAFHINSSEEQPNVIRPHLLAYHDIQSVRTTSPPSVAFQSPNLTTASDIGFQYALGVGNAAVAPFLDVVAPAQHQFDLINTRSIQEVWPDNVALMAHVGRPSASVADDDVHYFVLSGTADDGTFCHFLGFPSVES
jgi:hypothetical protein